MKSRMKVFYEILLLTFEYLFILSYLSCKNAAPVLICKAWVQCEHFKIYRLKLSFSQLSWGHFDLLVAFFCFVFCFFFVCLLAFFLLHLNISSWVQWSSDVSIQQPQNQCKLLQDGNVWSVPTSWYLCSNGNLECSILSDCTFNGSI